MKLRRSPSGKRSRTGYTLGRKGFAKISAVEGLRITAAMEADFREFERKGVPASKRRTILARKYAKVR
jgi:hypothetical protein